MANISSGGFISISKILKYLVKYKLTYFKALIVTYWYMIVEDIIGSEVILTGWSELGYPSTS